jgi:hypothetical protein
VEVDLMKKTIELVKLILHHEKQILVLENLKVKILKLILEAQMKSLEAEVKMKLELENKQVIIHY